MLATLKELYGKRVRAITNDNKIIAGKFCIYYRAGDNEYDCDSICIEVDPYNLIELKVTEIESIEESTE